MPNNPIYHHRIPKTYMKAWCFSGNSIWTYDKLTEKSEVRNIERICGQNHYHSIRAGSLYTNDHALKTIFGFLSDYKISLEGIQLNSLSELNEKFVDFDKWEIRYPNNKIVNKRDRNKIKSKLLACSDDTIEEQWNTQLENDWEKIRDLLTETVKRIQNKEQVALTVEDADVIMKYFVMFEWRGKIGNKTVNDLLDWLENDVFEFSKEEIPREERVYSYDNSISEELKHAFLLRSYDSFLSKCGAMYETYKIYREQLTFLFLISDKEPFITSDNPCFTFVNREGYKEPLLIVSPYFAVSLAKKDPDSPNAYKTIKLHSDDVSYYNQAVFQNGNLILSSDEYEK